MLSSIAMIANFHSVLEKKQASLGNEVRKSEAESYYIKYISLVQQFFDNDSLEVSNAYFLIGVYFFEKKEWKRSLCCYLKSLNSRSLCLGKDSMGVSDCHFNIAIIYKKLLIS